MSWAAETTTDMKAGYRALACPRFELIPLKGMIEQAGQLPRGATVTVTCSPKLGLDHTLETSEVLLGMGFVAVPHLSARLVRDRKHLQSILDRLAASGLQEVFVVGGDAPHPVGEFTSGWELLTAIGEMSPRPAVIGVPSYPEGHATIDLETLNDALQAKAAYADYTVTQICFDPQRILYWLREMYQDGPALPVYIGITGIMEMRRLLSIALKIGLGDSTRMLRKNGSMLGRLAHGYRPDDLIWDLAPYIGKSPLDIRGFHINTFNNVKPTLDWKVEMLEELARWYPHTQEGDEQESAEAAAFAQIGDGEFAPSGGQ